MSGHKTGSLRVTGASLLIGLITSAFLAEASYATPINRGTFVGTTVTFVDVTEDSATDPALVTPLGGLYGVPTISGDALDFNPKSFAASCPGPGCVSNTDNTDGNLQFFLVAHPGKAISSVAFTERGDTTLSGLSGLAYTKVTNLIFVDILELNGVPVSINLPTQVMAFTPSAGDFLLGTDILHPSGTLDWQGSILIDLGPYVPVGSAVTKVAVSLDNHLVALSQAGTSAFIQKKDFDGVSITVNTNVIPEPASIALVLLSAVSLAGFRRG